MSDPFLFLFDGGMEWLFLNFVVGNKMEETAVMIFHSCRLNLLIQ